MVVTEPIVKLVVSGGGGDEKRGILESVAGNVLSYIVTAVKGLDTGRRGDMNAKVKTSDVSLSLGTSWWIFVALKEDNDPCRCACRQIKVDVWRRTFIHPSPRCGARTHYAGTIGGVTAFCG